MKNAYIPQGQIFPENKEQKRGQRYLAFSVEGFAFGLDMADVVSVEKSAPGSLNNSPLPGPALHSHNGTPIPLWHLSALLDAGAAPSDPNAAARILILRSRTGLFALGIDKVHTLFGTADTQILPMPAIFKGQAMMFCPRILHTRNTLMALIDPDTFEKVALTQLHRLVRVPDNDEDLPQPLPDGVPFPSGAAPHGEPTDATVTGDIVTGEMLTASITRIVQRKVRQHLAQFMSEPSVEKIGRSLLDMAEGHES